MLASSGELWFNVAMLKSEAIQHLGGSVAVAARTLGISYQAVRQWPDFLTPDIANRVIASFYKRGKRPPKDLIRGIESTTAGAA
jgi:hypothetical protein